MLNKESPVQAQKKRKKAAAAQTGAIDRSIIHLLHRASQRASEIFALETRNFDLTARQYAVIATVAQHEGLSQTDLVRLTGIDRSTLADVVHRLLRRGIIQRERTMEDGRTYAVRLTKEGRELLETVKPHARRADRAVIAHIGEEEGKGATQILTQLLLRGAPSSNEH